MLKELLRKNVFGRIKDPLKDLGLYLDGNMGKFTGKGLPRGVDTETMWIHTNPDPSLACRIFQALVIQCNFIPKPCLNCWKVVVNPLTVVELMQLLKFQQTYTAGFAGKGRFCKCGVEPREYVPWNYGGYFYCGSEKEGLERYKDVREAMDRINPKMPVILKRYCTEFEIRLGPSSKYKWNEEAEEFSNIANSMIDFQSFTDQPKQPAFLQDHIKIEWIKFAYQRMDFTSMQLNDGEPLYSLCETYHQPKEEK